MAHLVGNRWRRRNRLRSWVAKPASPLNRRKSEMNEFPPTKHDCEGQEKTEKCKTKIWKNNLKYLLCRDFQFSFLFVDNIFVHGFLLACFSTNLDIDSIAYPLIAPLNVSIVQFTGSLYIVLLFFSTVLFTARFHSRDQQLCKFIKQKETFTEKKSSTPTGFVWYTYMAALLLFWSTNMSAVTSCENALFIFSFAFVVCS